MDEYKAKRAEKRRLDKLNKRRDIDKTRISSIAGWTDEDENYVKRRHRSPWEKEYKKVSNRKVRRYKDDLSNPSDYRKVFDYWWSIY